MKAEKTRNAGTMTESAFWGKIRSTLRRMSIYWKPIQIAKQKAKRVYVGPNKRQKFEYKCASCKQWHNDKNIQVDHIIECGSLKCANDLPGFVERMFSEDGYQVLCSGCHLLKSNLNKGIK